MGKKRVALIGIVLFIFILGISGKVYREKQEQKIVHYQKNEEKIVLDVLKIYSNVQTIEFTTIGENKMTGYTHYSFSLNGKSGFSYYFSKNELLGNESIIEESIKKRAKKLDEDDELKQLKKSIQVAYGGWNK